MKYGYARVSTKGQLDGNSIEEQTTAIKNLYSDAEIIIESYSGAKERPLFNQILEKAQQDDYVIVTKLDRFCRSTKEGLEYIDLLMNKGVKIHILNMVQTLSILVHIVFYMFLSFYLLTYLVLLLLQYVFLLYFLVLQNSNLLCQ